MGVQESSYIQERASSETEYPNMMWKLSSEYFWRLYNIS